MSNIKLFQSELTVDEAKSYLKRLTREYYYDRERVSFTFDGQELLTSLAKYMIEYLTNELKRRGEKV